MKAVPQESAAFNSFCREIALMAKLRHLNVLRLLGVASTRTARSRSSPT